MTNRIDNAEDVIDSRDIIARIAELEAEREDCIAREDYFSDEEYDELTALEALAKEAADYAPDWEYGATLIRDSYFMDYAQELAEDTGAINRDAQWPNNCIDWEQAANELRMDYTPVDFGGVTYWVR